MEYAATPIYVIGSGLSAAAAVVALVRRGYCPTVLDVGVSPDPASQILKDRLSAVEPSEWHQEDITWIRQTGRTAVNGIPRKLHFGSDYTFSEVEVADPLEVCGASTPRSFAMGGFSNVWGTVIQLLSARDLEEWPITTADLAPHYRAVYALLCDTRQEPPKQIPQSKPILRPSAQADALYSDLESNRQALGAEGIEFGYACLGVHRSDYNGQQSCRYCGLCLYGCPYGCTYNAGTTLTSLQRAGLIHYLPGMLVDKFILTRNQVLIEARSVADGTIQTFQANRVFLAAGVLETARIILVSLGLYNTPVCLRQSDIFTLPFLRYKTAGDVFSENLHTLCQLVAEVEDDRICEQPMHLQFYGYNDLYLKILKKKMKGIGSCVAPLLRTVVARLFTVFGYLHSDFSSEIEIKLSSNGRALLVTGRKNPAADQIMRRLARKLFRNRKLLHGIPLSFAARMDLPGGSYHTGSAFPMRQTPGFLETDSLGRLAPLPGVHIVDASVLPNVPASPMAFTVMANAHRIVSECLKPNGQ